jgi:hypothetical protein
MALQGTADAWRRRSLVNTSSSPCNRTTDRWLWCSVMMARRGRSFISRASQEVPAVTGNMTTGPAPRLNGESQSSRSR